MAKLIFTAHARSDLETIGDWIARDDPVRAGTFIQHLRDACADLLDFPSAYPIIGDIAGAPVHKRTVGAYLILYEIDNHDVRILAIRHGARDPGAILK